MEFTKEQITKGFEEWERQYREDSSPFLDEAEKTGLTLEAYGKKCANCLIEAMGVGKTV